MLKKLRSLSPDAKKKVIILCSGSITFVVFLFWIFNFSAIFSSTWNNTVEKGAAAYGVVEENIGKVYNAFTEIIPENTNVGVDLNASTTSATSTTEIASTTASTTEEIRYDEEKPKITN